MKDIQANSTHFQLTFRFFPCDHHTFFNFCNLKASKNPVSLSVNVDDKDRASDSKTQQRETPKPNKNLISNP